jgi:CRP/FNR family transcriptional regulator, cyclic AMP receptor protein
MSFIPSHTAGLQILDHTVFPEGATIFREGENGSRAYIVQRGKVEFYKKLDNEDILLGSVGTGGIFGEMALIDDEPRMATAIVSEPTVCIVISEALFQKKLGALDPFLCGVLRVLVENIRSIQDQKIKSVNFETATALPQTGADYAAPPDFADDFDSDAFEVA